LNYVDNRRKKIFAKNTFHEKIKQFLSKISMVKRKFSNAYQLVRSGKSLQKTVRKKFIKHTQKTSLLEVEMIMIILRGLKI
jgi:hypothetical protein